MNNIDVNAINKKVFLDQTPQMAKDQMKRKLYGESINEIGDTPKGRYMIGQAAHKVRNDDLRWQKISNYLRDKYGWTPREYFDGQNDASYGVNKYNTEEDVPPFIEPYVRKVAKESVDRFNESKNMNKKLIRLTESDLHRIVKESVNKMLKEDYSTPPLKDRISFANYANVSDEGYIDDKEDSDSMASNLREVNDHLDEIEELLFNGNFEGIGDAQNGAEKYFDYLTKCINRAKKCVSRIVKLNQMNRGMQPNVLGSETRLRLKTMTEVVQILTIREEKAQIKNIDTRA